MGLMHTTLLGGFYWDLYRGTLQSSVICAPQWQKKKVYIYIHIQEVSFEQKQASVSLRTEAQECVPYPGRLFFIQIYINVNQWGMKSEDTEVLCAIVGFQTKCATVPKGMYSLFNFWFIKFIVWYVKLICNHVFHLGCNSTLLPY